MEEKNNIRKELRGLPKWAADKSGQNGFEVSEQKLEELSDKALVSHRRQQAKARGWYRTVAAAVIALMISTGLWIHFTVDNNQAIMAENGYSDMYFDYLSEQAMLLEDEDLIELLGDLYLQSLDDQSMDIFYEEGY